MDPTYLKIGGVFHVSHVRDGKVIAEYDSPNGITNNGFQAMLTALRGDPITGGNSQWYLGILKRVGLNPALQDADTWITNVGNPPGFGRWTTMHTILGWGGVLDPISFDLASGGTMLASVAMQTVLFTTTEPLQRPEGFFIGNRPTTANTQGILWCTSAVTQSTATDLSSGDVLTVSYTISTSIGTKGTGL